VISHLLCSHLTFHLTRGDMPKFLDTRGNSSLSIFICDRCKMKRPYDELQPDGNLPGIKVCQQGCSDQFDPYRLAPRQPEKISIRFPRPDAPIGTNPDAIITENPDSTFALSPEQNTQTPENNGNLDNLSPSAGQ